MENSAYCYHPSTAALVKSAGPAWIYTSGLRGAGRFTVDVVTPRGIVAAPCETPPTIDGDLNDPCWDGARPTPFADTARFALSPHVTLFIKRDADSLYIACRRKGFALPAPRPAGAPEAADAWERDAFHVFITDGKRKRGARFGVDLEQGPFEEGGVLPRRQNLDRTWQGQWSSAVKRRAGEWTAEMAIPLDTLTKVGMDTAKLQLNCMARILCPNGLQEIYLTDPVFRFAHCIGFRPLLSPPPPPPERLFTVRLHFAENRHTAPGRRVFDVTLQGKTVLRELDVVKETGAPHTALVKEFNGVQARDAVALELTPCATGAAPPDLPLLNAVEIIEETGK